MNRLRQALIVLLAALFLGGVPACGQDDVKREAKQAGEKAKKEGKQAADKAKKKAEEAKNKAEKAKKDVDGQ
jgi:hypothetical protein